MSEERTNDAGLYWRPGYVRPITRVQPPMRRTPRAWAMKFWQPKPKEDNIASGFYRPVVREVVGCGQG